MEKHGIRFMEIASIEDAVSTLYPGRYTGVPGFVAFCEETGTKVATCEGDGWSGYTGAPKDPIERVTFAMNLHCGGHSHEILDEA